MKLKKILSEATSTEDDDDKKKVAPHAPADVGKRVKPDDAFDPDEEETDDLVDDDDLDAINHIDGVSQPSPTEVDPADEIPLDDKSPEEPEDIDRELSPLRS